MSRFSFLKTAESSFGHRLSEEEELELVKKIQAGDSQAYVKLRKSLRPLMEQIVSSAMPSTGDVSPSILRTKAENQLKKIIKKYDAEQSSTKLKTYITSQLKGHLRNTVSEKKIGPYVPRNRHTDLQRYRGAVRGAEMEYGNNPTESQIRQFYPDGEANQPFDVIKNYHVKSYLSDAQFSGSDEDDEALTFKDQFTADDSMISDDDLYDGLESEESEQMLKDNFEPAEQAIVKSVNNEGNSFIETALSLGTSTAEIRRVMRKWYNMNNN